MPLPWRVRRGKFEHVRTQGSLEMAVKQGNLLGMIQQSARNGTLLSSCEPEVRELMNQIDVLISGKQAEWAGQWAGLETQLREKERELAAVRHTLWQKDTELEQLRHQMKVSSTPHKTSDDMTTQNDTTHTLQLKAELGKMTEKYEQLKARRRKHSNTQSVSVRKSGEEIHQLRQDKQALESACASLQRDKSVLGGQLNLAQLETSTLHEKCAALEGEVKFCRSQLDQKDSLIAAIEQSSSVKTKQFEAQLKRAQELAESRDLALQKVRSECEERRREVETVSAETLSLNTQLAHSQAAARQLKGKYAELQLQVKKVEEQLKVTGNQLTQREQSVKLLQESSRRKDDLVRSLGGRQAHASELNRVRHELGRVQSQLQTHMQQEKSLQVELRSLKQRSATDKQDLARLTAECASKNEELAVLNHSHSTELRELQSQLSKMAQEKALALAQREAECAARLAGPEKQQRLLLENIVRATTSTQGRDTSCGTRNAASHTSASSTHHKDPKAPSTIPTGGAHTITQSHPTELRAPTSAPITIPTGGAHTITRSHPTEPRAPTSAPITIPTGGAHSVAHSTPSHTTYSEPPSQPPSTSAAIETFLREADKISRVDSSHNRTDTLNKDIHAHVPLQPTQPQCITKEEDRADHGEGFIPLKPVYSQCDDGDISTQPEHSFTCVGGTTGHRDKEGSSRGGERGGVREEGEYEGRGDGGPQLEDMFAKTLDGIVDSHFQKLDSSLRKLMSKET